MRHLASMAVAVVASGLLGAGFTYLHWNSLISTCVAATVGWAVGSLIAAAGWLIYPPAGVDVVAVSIGLHEAVVSTGVTVVLALLVHFGVAALAGATSRWLEFRAAIASALGAFAGLLGFAFGAGVRGVN